MNYATIRDVYTAFSELYGSEKPEWSQDQLQDWLQERHIRYEDITSDILGEAFDESIQPDNDGCAWTLEDGSPCSEPAIMVVSIRGSANYNACRTHGDNLLASLPDSGMLISGPLKRNNAQENHS
jgi:hypothetical protein